jgi:hypothetical protein
VNQTGGEVNQTGGELERRSEALPVPYVPGQRGSETGDIVDWPQLAAWVRARGRSVVLSGLALIAAQLIWKSVFLGHFYFRQDDFHVIELALGHSFSWNYLTYVGAGHLIPGVYAIAWVVARISLYSWGLASAVTVVMLAGAGLAALRLLRTLFGTRPAILLPLAVYLLIPLTMPDLGWWTSAIESLPVQIATFAALNAQVHYVRTHRFRHAVAAAAWLLFGLVFFEKAVILPLLLLAVTSGFLTDGPWLRAIGRCLVSYWRGWALQLAVVAGYVAVLLVSLQTSSVRPGIPGSDAGVLTFVWEIVKDTFTPGAIGGPWQWLPATDQEYAYSAPPAALAGLSLIVAAAVIGASIWSRKDAWRAWAILAGWLVAADIAPVLLGRISELGPHLIGLETRYVADAAPVLAICLGLAFWPVAGRPDAASRRWAFADGSQQTGRMVAAGAVGAFIIGSVWSVQAYQNATTSLPDQIFIANARVAVAQAPAGTLIFDEPVPPALMLGIFGRYSYASGVVRPMESAQAAARIRWTPRLQGTVDNLMVFGGDGKLRQAAVFGQAGIPTAPGQSCESAKRGQIVVPFPRPTSPFSQVLHIAYLAAAKVSGDYAMVSYGRSSQQLTVRPGLHDAYFPVRGSADSVTLSGPAVAGLCVGGTQAGVVVPSSSGPVFPAAP